MNEGPTVPPIDDITRRFLNRSKSFRLATAWGGFESLILGGPPFSERCGQPQRLVRVHVGLESKEDLTVDLKEALED
ncbi:MAG: PLP-dependent transferase [Phycisphaerae bacterium]